MSDEPTELTKHDIDVFLKRLSESESEIKIIKCTWCNLSQMVREVGPNYICYDCEKKEREAGREIIFTSPIKDTFFVLTQGVDDEIP